MENQTRTLEPGTEIQAPERVYTVIRVLGQGGFGITYLVSGKIKVGNILVDVKFALKEHFISSLCSRDEKTHTVLYSSPVAEEVNMSLKSFIREAERLQGLGISHPNIVKINEVFEANNTAYYVMEYLGRTTLQDYVTANGAMSPQAAKHLLRPVFEAVDTLHRNHIAHYDIKPGNIMLCEDDSGNVKPVLIDFGLSKHYNDSGTATSTLAAAGYSPGYAPVEQYAGIKEFSPQCDVYALAATLYFCLTGHTPKTAFELRPSDIEGDLAAILTPGEIAKLTRALAMMKEVRTPDAATLCQDLFADNGPRVVLPPPPPPPLEPPHDSSQGGTRQIVRKHGKRLPLAGMIVGVVVLLLAVAGYFMLYPSWLKKKGDESFDNSDYATALSRYRKAADMGNADAQEKLGNMYLDGNGVEKNVSKAIEWYVKAAENGNVDAQFSLGLIYSDGEVVERNYDEALRYYTLAADNGDRDAINNLGTLYLNCLEERNDTVKAFRLFEEAAEMESPEALLNIAAMYKNGWGTDENMEKAAEYYRRAVDQDLVKGQYYLGTMYLNGEGVPVDYDEAMRLLSLGADKGDAMCQNAVGYMYANGFGVKKNAAKAFEWYTKAAEQGYDMAQRNLGELYFNGQGTSVDYAKAARMYRLAAEQGNDLARNDLGYMYENGLGVKRDYNEAFRWYKAAADQGNIAAISNVGVMYLNGYGVKADAAEAKKWLQRAADLGNETAAEILNDLF